MSTSENVQLSDLRHNTDKLFGEFWGEMGVPKSKQIGDSWITPTYNRGNFESRLRATQSELEEKGLEDARVYKGMARNALNKAVGGEGVSKDTLVEAQKQNIIDRNIAENSTPLVFDPEILDLLKDSAPLAMDRLNRRGQEGYTAVYNRIDDRQFPLGYIDEATSTRLQDLARDHSLTREDVDMKIYADTAEIADFSATAASHYMDLEELAIGARMSEYALLHEQTILYGDPSAGLEFGGPLAPDAYDGLAQWYSDAGNTFDKSAVTSGFVEDIKFEITRILQGDYASNITDLEIWTSETMKETFEREIGLEGNVLRFDLSNTGGNVNVGGETFELKGEVPVHASHNVDEHTYYRRNQEGELLDGTGSVVTDPNNAASQTVGSEGDVFIVNTASAEYRELAPLSTFPLAVRGAADEVAMVEYGALIERSGGNFGRHLQNYADASGTGSLAP